MLAFYPWWTENDKSQHTEIKEETLIPCLPFYHLIFLLVVKSAAVFSKYSIACGFLF